MSVPPLHFNHAFDSYISGEVIIHPSAVIAPGVILQAAPNSKIIIGQGVCIGMGSILHVHEGTLEVESGASLGAGFLMVGEGKIGANACIGSATTVFNCSVEAGQVIPPGSILGDTSRRVSESVTPIEETDLETKQMEQSASELGTTQPTHQTYQSQGNPNNGTSPHVEDEEPPLPSSSSTESSSDSQVQPNADSSALTPFTQSQNNSTTQIYGQGNIQRLLITLFPHRQSLNTPTSDDEQSD
jgi:carbon dioxide concentrating mechanism protein CcmN